MIRAPLLMAIMQGHPPPEIYHRWVAYGLFSSHSRLHGSMSYRVPWHYGEEAAAYMSRFLDAKHRLMPYLYMLVRPVSTLPSPRSGRGFARP